MHACDRLGGGPGLRGDLEGLRRASAVTEEVADHPAQVVLWVGEEGVQLGASWAVLWEGSQPAHHLQAPTTRQLKVPRFESGWNTRMPALVRGKGGTFLETNMQRMELSSSSCGSLPTC